MIHIKPSTPNQNIKYVQAPKPNGLAAAHSSSMDSPASNFFSQRITYAIPSMNKLHKSTSE
jgi:hypothetical protein